MVVPLVRVVRLLVIPCQSRARQSRQWQSGTESEWVAMNYRRYARYRISGSIILAYCLGRT